MEHRYDERTETEMRVLIYMKPGTFVDGTARNISPGGLCMATHRSRELKPNASVKITYLANGRLVIQNAQILRMDNENVALMFIDKASALECGMNAGIPPRQRTHFATPLPFDE